MGSNHSLDGLASEFQPAPHVNGARMPVWRLVMLRIVEVVSPIVLAGFPYYCVAKPLYLRREFHFDGKFVVCGFIALTSDGFLNGQQYIFAWNSYAVNRESWAAFMPFHDPDAPMHYTGRCSKARPCACASAPAWPSSGASCSASCGAAGRA